MAKAKGSKVMIVNGMLFSLVLLGLVNAYAVVPVTCDIGVLAEVARYQNEQYGDFATGIGSLGGISKVEFLREGKITSLKMSGSSYPKKKKCSARIFYSTEAEESTFGCPRVKITSVNNNCD